MYVDRSSRKDSKKYKFIDELNLENCVYLRRKTTSKLFVGIAYKTINFIIHPEYFDASNIFSYPFIHNLKNKPNMVQYLSRQMKIPLKIYIDWRIFSNSKYIKYYASLARMVKHNTMEGNMRKTKLF